MTIHKLQSSTNQPSSTYFPRRNESLLSRGRRRSSNQHTIQGALLSRSWMKIAAGQWRNRYRNTGRWYRGPRGMGIGEDWKIIETKVADAGRKLVCRPHSSQWASAVRKLDFNNSWKPEYRVWIIVVSVSRLATNGSMSNPSRSVQFFFLVCCFPLSVSASGVCGYFLTGFCTSIWKCRDLRFQVSR